MEANNVLLCLSVPNVTKSKEKNIFNIRSCFIRHSTENLFCKCSVQQLVVEDGLPGCHTLQ